MVRVRNEDVNRIMASISDTVFALSLSDIEKLKELPREVREKAVNGNGSVKEPSFTPVSPPPPSPSPPPPTAPKLGTPAPSETATTPAVVTKSPPAPTTPIPPASKINYVEANLEFGGWFLENLKKDVDRYFRNLEMFVEEDNREKFEKSYKKDLDSFTKYYYVFGFRTIFEDTKLNGLRAAIYSTVLGGFEDIMVTLRNDIAPFRNNTRLEEMLSMIYEAVSEGTARVGMAGARGPKGMVPWLASVMCKLLKTLDTFGDNYYKDGVEAVCRDVETTILRKFDALINKR
jgi:hypothetical protein